MTDVDGIFWGSNNDWKSENSIGKSKHHFGIGSSESHKCEQQDISKSEQWIKYFS